MLKKFCLVLASLLAVSLALNSMIHQSKNPCLSHIGHVPMLLVSLRRETSLVIPYDSEMLISHLIASFYEQNWEQVRIIGTSKLE